MNESAPTAQHNPWLSVAIVCIAQLMVVLDATVVNVALPSIQRGLGLSPANLQWVVNAYTLTFGGFLLLGGRHGRPVRPAPAVLRRRRVFTAASLINGLASSSGMLIGSRALQGLGAALVSPAALAIVNTTFPGGDDQRKALSLFAALSAGGAAIGLLMGGILTQALSWPWISSSTCRSACSRSRSRCASCPGRAGSPKTVARTCWERSRSPAAWRC